MEELTEDQLKELEQDLLAVRDTLRVALTASEASAQPVELDQAAVGRVTRIDAIQQQTMAKANVRAQKIRAGQVDRAIQAIQDDEYGYCRRCEEPIGYRRLKAKPEAPFCVGCQDKLARR